MRTQAPQAVSESFAPSSHLYSDTPTASLSYATRCTRSRLSRVSSVPHPHPGCRCQTHPQTPQELEGIKRVGPEIVTEQSIRCERVFIHAKMLCDKALHLVSAGHALSTEPLVSVNAHASAVKCASLLTTRPMIVFGVEAPAVRPMERGPLCGSQPPTMTSSCPSPRAVAAS